MTCRDILKRVWPNASSSAYQIALDNTYWQEPNDTCYEIVACHSTLRPYDCDPAYYNHYLSVQCNPWDRYQYGGPVCPAKT